MDVPQLERWIPTMVAGFAMGLIWFDIKRFKSDMRKSLYNEDGTTIYVPRSECEREQARCQKLTCGKIDDLAKKLEQMDAKREAAKDQQLAFLIDVKQQLAELSGRFDQLQNDR